MESCFLAQDCSAAEKLEDVEKKRGQVNAIVECSICIDLFTDPRILPCIHTFCLKCLQETAVKYELKPGDSMPCPLCRTPFVIPKEGIAGLKRNIFLERLVEVNKIPRPPAQRTICEICSQPNANGVSGFNFAGFATHYCIACHKNICDHCSKSHRQFEELRSHQIFLLGKLMNEDLLKEYNGHYCEVHKKKELEMYCTKCDEVVCVKCFAAKHNTHDCSHIENSADKFRLDINKYLEDMKFYPKEQWSKIEEISGAMKTFQQEVEKTEKTIIASADELKEKLHNKIDTCTKSLLNELTEIKLKILKQLTAEKEEIERRKKVIESFEMYCGQLVAKGSAAEICRNASGLRSRKMNEQIEKLRNYYWYFGYKQKFPPAEICFKGTNVESFSKEDNIVGTLLVYKFPTQCLDLCGSSAFDDVKGVTKLGNRIYVLFANRKSISIFEDQVPFCFQEKIDVKEISEPSGIVCSEKSHSLYICDRANLCIWKLTTDDHRLTKLVTSVFVEFTLSVSTDDRLLLLRNGTSLNGLDIYESDGKHIQSLFFSADIENRCQCIQTSNGEFMISHKDVKSKQWIITHLCSDGQKIIRQLHPRDKSEAAICPFSLFLDSGTDQPVVFDSVEQTVIQFDSNSRRSKQILQTTDRFIPSLSKTVFYDSMKRQFLSCPSYSSRLDIYQL